MPPRCQVTGCLKPSRNRGWCWKHYTRWRRHGDTGVVVTPRHWQHSAARNHNWRGDAVTYRGAHDRVRRARGKASEHRCRCGEPAQTWAYDHADQNEKRDARGRPYSADPQHYAPLCWPCHSAFDRSR